MPHLSYPLAIDFANSVGPLGDPVGDLFASSEGVVRWLRHERDRLGDLDVDTAQPTALRRFRKSVDEVLRAVAAGLPPRADDVAAVNRASARVRTHPRLAFVGAGVRAVEETGGADPVLVVLSRVARSCIELVVGPLSGRLRTCGAPSCGLLFIASRTAQTWCSAACGNRARVARHYRRR